MKFLTVSILTTLLTAVAQAADSQEVAFLTALVSDYDSHKRDYINFIQTANNVPQDLTALARAVLTYTDDSYTTLLDASSIDVKSLESFATGLPWYSRLAIEARQSASESGSVTTTASGSSSALSSSSKSSSTYTRSTSAGSGAISYAPIGAVLGAAAVALL